MMELNKEFRMMELPKEFRMMKIPKEFRMMKLSKKFRMKELPKETEGLGSRCCGVRCVILLQFSHFSKLHDYR